MFQLRSWAKLVRDAPWRAAAAAIFGGGGLSSVATICYNATEEHRMARAIQRGRFRPKTPGDFDERFVNFDIPTIHQGLAKNGMVALIGMKATGKTSTLQTIIHQAENPFYIEAFNDNTYRMIYEELRNGIWWLPGSLDAFRMNVGKSYEKVVIQVFKKVNQNTQKPVRLGIDVRVASKQHSDDSSQGYLQTTNFEADFFVKKVKDLCADNHVASAPISSSEGLVFLSVQEPRLRKLLTKELSMEKSKVGIPQDLGRGEHQ